MVGCHLSIARQLIRGINERDLALCPGVGNMRAEDVTDTIEFALAASECDQAVVRHMPRLLSDNGSK